MKSPWQYVLIATVLTSANGVSVYNLKRRIASLPPIPLSVFKGQIQTSVKPAVAILQHSRSETTEKAHESTPNQCLFCPFDNDDKEGSVVIEHMFAAHGFFVPDQTMLSDPTSFLGYLAIQVREWHECLYCGVTRTSTLAIQDHMKDSSHCKLNFDKEPELLEFWERENDTPSEVAAHWGSTVGAELRLASRKAMTLSNPRRAAFQTRRARQKPVALTTESDVSQPQDLLANPQCRQLLRRNEQGIQNISSQQRHALTVAARRSQKEEAAAKQAKELIYARKANDQKHDQAYGPLSWAKGGMHNLLPR